MNQTKPTNTEAPAPRRYHSPADKVRILRLHLLEGRAISEVCEAEDIHPTMFYQWQKTFFEKCGAASGYGDQSPELSVHHEHRPWSIFGLR